MNRTHSPLTLQTAAQPRSKYSRWAENGLTRTIFPVALKMYSKILAETIHVQFALRHATLQVPSHTYKGVIAPQANFKLSYDIYPNVEQSDLVLIVFIDLADTVSSIEWPSVCSIAPD